MRKNPPLLFSIIRKKDGVGGNPLRNENMPLRNGPDSLSKDGGILDLHSMNDTVSSLELDNSHKLDVLAKIAHQLNPAQLTWSLGSSCFLYLKGKVATFHDLDFMVVEADAPKAIALLSALGEIQPPHPSAHYPSKRFTEFIIEGVDIDLISGFKIRKGDQVYDCSLVPNQIKEYLDVRGEKIPVQSLELWRRYYTLMDRPEKVAIIDHP
jgi:hypothetical protein